MSGYVGILRGGAAWIGAVALAAHVGAARAQTPQPAGDPTAPVAAVGAPATPMDAPSTPGEARSPACPAGLDCAPTGTTAGPSRDRPSAIVVAAPAATEIAPLDLARTASEAERRLIEAPLPPETEPPNSRAAIASIDIPQAPAYASPGPEPPPPSASLAPSEIPAAPSEGTPPELPGAPEAPAGAAASQDIAAALEAALDALVAQPQTFNPLGAGDWKAARESVRAFYAARSNAPVWVGAHGLTDAGRSVLARLRRADEDGLDLRAFALPPPTFHETRLDRLAEVEATLSAAVVAYALQASGARIVPSTISPVAAASPAVADPAAALQRTASAAEPGETLAAFNPSQPGYRDLRDQLAQIRELSPIEAAQPPTGPTLLIGMADARVPLIRSRFGLGAAADPAGARVYDARVASAVAAFQRSRGLAANGALTAATNAALFGDPSARRKAAILANMEMWRWEPHEMGEMRVEINVPDFTMRVINGDDEVLRARVIVGKPDTPTPIFSNAITYILVNPVWRVPDSIIKKEMLPKLADDPDYLTRRGFKVTQVGDRLVVEQPPGEANALGRILFMFPNEHAVYLHDTPMRGLFASARRAYSHGCIRLEQPLRLAELAMGGASRGWAAGRVQSMIGSSERTVFLPRPLPIHIEYFTEFVDASGALQEREDVYGLTARVAATLSRLRQD